MLDPDDAQTWQHWLDASAELTESLVDGGSTEDLLKCLRVQAGADVAGIADQPPHPDADDPRVLYLRVGTGRAHNEVILRLARDPERAPFSAADAAMAGMLARQGGLAIALGEATAVAQRLLLLEERERIARDLHDHVIQRLFAIGLRLQGAATDLGDPEAPATVLRLVDDLDETILQIRSAIFQLTVDPGADSLRARLLRIAADAAPALGFKPSVRFSGLLDDYVVGSLADDAMAVVREGLANVARHARARTVDVAIESSGWQLRIDVIDDGVGLAPTGRRSGLANLEQRAALRGGELTLRAGDRGGTHLRWTALVSAPEQISPS